MGRIAIGAFESAPLICQIGERVTASGQLETRALLSDERDHIHVFYHQLEDGASLTIVDPGQDHCLYVKVGAVKVCGDRVGSGGCIVIEHGAAATVTSAGRSVLVLFCDRRAHEKPGGRVHVTHPEGAPHMERTTDHEGIGTLMLADSSCETCGVWLHENTINDLSWIADRHFHAVDEILLVLDGEIALGARTYGPGTAVFIERGTIYSFVVTQLGTRFLNFYGVRPGVTMVGDGAFNKGGETDYVAFFRDRLGSPEHVYVSEGSVLPGSMTAAG